MSLMNFLKNPETRQVYFSERVLNNENEFFFVASDLPFTRCNVLKL